MLIIFKFFVYVYSADHRYMYTPRYTHTHLTSIYCNAIIACLPGVLWWPQHTDLRICVAFCRRFNIAQTLKNKHDASANALASAPLLLLQQS